MKTAAKYHEDLCDKLIEEMSKGISYHAFAGLIKVNPKTLYRWEEAHPEWLEAKEIAFASCLYFWERTGINGLADAKGFNSVVWYMNMKNRFGWRDTPPEDKPQAQQAQVLRLPIEDIKSLVKEARAKK